MLSDDGISCNTKGSEVMDTKGPSQMIGTMGRGGIYN